MSDPKIGGDVQTVKGTSPAAYSELSDDLLDRVMPRISAALAKFQKEIYIVTSLTRVDCPDCSFDPQTETGSDPNCPTCKGDGKIDHEEFISVMAVKENVTAEDYEMTQAGRLSEGDIILTISAAEMERTGLTKRKIESARFIRTAEVDAAEASGEILDTESTKWVVEYAMCEEIADRFTDIEIGCSQWEEAPTE